MKKRGISILSVLVVILVIFGGGFWYVYQPFYPENKIFHGIKIIGIDVGGMSKDMVNRKIENKMQRIIKDPVILSYQNKSYTIDPQKVNFNINKDDLIQQAVNFGRSGGIISRFTERWKLKNDKINIQPNFEVSENKIRQQVMGIAKELDKKPRDARFMINKRKVILVDGLSGIKVDVDKNVENIKSALLNGDTKSQNLEVSTLNPDITKKTFEEQGIIGTVATFTTSFKTSQESRKYNIKIAAEAFNNLLIKPNGEFSFNKIIKDKKVDKKYKVAKIIKNNKFVLGDGGGVCQVSTTLYNSVLLANLKVVERSHHSVPVSYVPLGQDATVSENISDFKFQNSKDKSIMILTHIENDSLTFYILGRPINQKIKLFSELIKKENQETVKILDNQLPNGIVKTEKGSPFYEVKVYRNIYENGKLAKREEISHDKYKKVDNEIRIGTASIWN